MPSGGPTPGGGLHYWLTDDEFRRHVAALAARAAPPDGGPMPSSAGPTRAQALASARGVIAGLSTAARFELEHRAAKGPRP